MNRFTPMLGITLLCVGMTGAAFAQDKSTTATHATTKSSTSAKKTNPAHKVQVAAVGQVRDWKAIDKNHDNLIEPEEMENYLNQSHKASHS